MYDSQCTVKGVKYQLLPTNSIPSNIVHEVDWPKMRAQSSGPINTQLAMCYTLYATAKSFDIRGIAMANNNKSH